MPAIAAMVSVSPPIDAPILIAFATSSLQKSPMAIAATATSTASIVVPNR